jgi:hypothetical protein
MRVIARARVFVEVVMACSVGISRAVAGVVGPKVFETRLLRGSGGRRLGVLSWRMECLKRGAKRAVVFTPGEKG